MLAPKPSKKTRELAMYVAKVVRNEMEDFHCKYISDSQMKELNPIIRNAICTALYAAENQEEDSGARSFVSVALKLIPKYWEEPELTQTFMDCLDLLDSGEPH